MNDAERRGLDVDQQSWIYVHDDGSEHRMREGMVFDEQVHEMMKSGVPVPEGVATVRPATPTSAAPAAPAPQVLPQHPRPTNTYVGSYPFMPELERNYHPGDQPPWTMRINGEPGAFGMGNTPIEAREALLAHLRMLRDSEYDRARKLDFVEYITRARQFDIAYAVTQVSQAYLANGNPCPSSVGRAASTQPPQQAPPPPPEDSIPRVTLFQGDETQGHDDDTWTMRVTYRGWECTDDAETARSARNNLVDKLNTALSVCTESSRRKMLRECIQAVGQYEIPAFTQRNDDDDLNTGYTRPQAPRPNPPSPIVGRGLRVKRSIST
jgi:hypothetical protein